MTGSMAEINPAAPIFTADTIQYYLDHRKLLQAEKKKGEDIDLGTKLFALIYSKEILKDPMVALMMFQQLLLPIKEDIQDDGQGIFAHQLEMTADLNTIVNTAETMFNKGAKITPDEATRFAYLLLFLTAIPFAKDLNPQVVANIQSAMTDLATKVFNCGPIARNPAAWAGRILADQQYIFNTANNGGDEHNKECTNDIKNADQDFDQCTGMTTSSTKMLQNDAKTSANDEKVQLGAYSKMADAQTDFEKSVNRGLLKSR